MTLRFLFWNYRSESSARESILASLIHGESIDVLILTETSVNSSVLCDLLSSRGRHYHAMPMLHEHMQVYAGFPPEFFLDWSRDQERLCLRRIQMPGHPEIILGALHLASGLHLERSERKSRAVPLAQAIREAQRELNHARAIVVGDFNLNPFDDGMIASDGFGAMTTKSLVKKYALYHEDRYSRLYNPMWSRLGREEFQGPPGTYYWKSLRDINLYWNYVDQVLVGHDLLDQFPDDRFRILDSIPGRDGPTPLIRETKRHWKIQISDHLPLLFELDLTPEATDG